MPEEVPQWVAHNHPNIAAVVFPLAQLLRANADAPNCELEFRLLVADPDGRLSANVRFEAQDALLRRCADEQPAGAGVCVGGLRFSPWCEHADYFHDDTRTRVEYNSDSYAVTAASIRKRRLGRVDVECGDWVVRLDAKQETPVPAAELPDAAHTSRVCLAHRCSAVCAASDGGPPMWRYDCTQTWAAATRGAAEEAQSGGSAPQYHIEIEYIGGAERLQQLGADYVACSGLLKALDVVGCASAPCRTRRASDVATNSAPTAR